MRTTDVMAGMACGVRTCGVGSNSPSRCIAARSTEGIGRTVLTLTLLVLLLPADKMTLDYSCYDTGTSAATVVPDKHRCWCCAAAVASPTTYGLLASKLAPASVITCSPKYFGASLQQKDVKTLPNQLFFGPKGQKPRPACRMSTTPGGVERGGVSATQTAC
jgi:hypothetical protein